MAVTRCGFHEEQPLRVLRRLRRQNYKKAVNQDGHAALKDLIKTHVWLCPQRAARPAGPRAESLREPRGEPGTALYRETGLPLRDDDFLSQADHVAAAKRCRPHRTGPRPPRR